MGTKKLSSTIARAWVFGIMMVLFFCSFSRAESLAQRNTSDLSIGTHSNGLEKELLADHNNDGVSDGLQKKLSLVPANQLLDVVVTMSGPGNARSAQQAVGRFNVKREFSIIKGFSAKMTAAQVKALAKVPGVFRVEENFKVYATLNSANRDFGTEAARDEFGLTGEGICVCVLDTGIDPTHEQLDNGKVGQFQDFIGTETGAYDDHGHGTHVSSIAAGDGNGNLNALTYKGVAPAATIYAAKVLDYLGQGTADDIISGVEWCANNPEVDIISMSLGSTGSSDGKDSISQAVNTAVLDYGKIAVVAAGNSGSGTYTIGSPGAASEAITVGAAAEWSASVGSINHYEVVYLASFSGRGPTADGRNKPDVVGPGVSITAALYGTASDYITYSGTSMATPFVSGTVALALQANPDLTPEAIKAYLFSTTKDYGPSGLDNDWGAGLFDGYAFISKASGENGSNPFPTHQHLEGSVGDNSEWRFSFDVNDLSTPIAVSITVEGQPICPLGDIYCLLGLFPWEWTPDLDAELWGPGDKILATSICMVGDECGSYGRQETLHVMPSDPGTYTVVVYPYDGYPNNGRGGNFTIDISTGPVSFNSLPAVETSCTDQTDNDADGLFDCEDPDCYNDACCMDRDNDGLFDCNDGCPDDPSKQIPGICGCGVADTDTDGDNTPDCNDGCPGDANKTEPGICGCGTPDLDSDNDGTPDCNDFCPDDPYKVEPGNCGCGAPEGECPADSCEDCFKGKCDGVCTRKDGPTCPDCTPSANELCNDGVDNDGDDFIDCVDPDCDSSPSCSNGSPDCLAKSSQCVSDSECCSGKCRGGKCR